MILARKILPVRDAITQLADTCKPSHMSADFWGLAGGTCIGVPHNHGRSACLVLLDSAGVKWFGTIERASLLIAVTVVRDVYK